MIEVILGEEKFGVPIRFKERVGTDAIRIEKILVRINDGGVRVSRNLAGYLGECVFRQFIILIQERTPLAAGERQRGIGAGRDMTILVAKEDFDPTIFAGQLFQKGFDSEISGGVVGYAHFPVFINLSADRRDGPLEKFQVAIVDRQDD